MRSSWPYLDQPNPDLVAVVRDRVLVAKDLEQRGDRSASDQGSATADVIQPPEGCVRIASGGGRAWARR